MTPYVIAGLVVMGAAAVGVQTLRLSSTQAELEAARRTHAEHLAADERAARLATEQARQAEAQRQAHIEEVMRDARTEIDRARRDAVAADRVAQRLREHIAVLVMPGAGTGTATANPDPAAGSPPATGPGLVLAQLFGRADDRAGQLARYADDAAAAGRACERAYEALIQR